MRALTARAVRRLPLAALGRRTFVGGPFETDYDEIRAKARRRTIAGLLCSLDPPAGCEHEAAVARVVSSTLTAHAASSSFDSREQLQAAVDEAREQLSAMGTGSLVLELAANYAEVAAGAAPAAGADVATRVAAADAASNPLEPSLAKSMALPHRTQGGGGGAAAAAPTPGRAEAASSDGKPGETSDGKPGEKGAAPEAESGAAPTGPPAWALPYNPNEKPAAPAAESGLRLDAPAAPPNWDDDEPAVLPYAVSSEQRAALASARASTALQALPALWGELLTAARTDHGRTDHGAGTIALAPAASLPLEAALEAATVICSAEPWARAELRQRLARGVAPPAPTPSGGSTADAVAAAAACAEASVAVVCEVLRRTELLSEAEEVRSSPLTSPDLPFVSPLISPLCISPPTTTTTTHHHHHHPIPHPTTTHPPTPTMHPPSLLDAPPHRHG